MLGLIRRAKYANVAVAPANEDSVIAPPKENLSIRARYDSLLEPKRRAHKYTDRVLHKLGYDTVLKAVEEGNIFEYIASPDLRELISKSASFCLDSPEENFSNCSMITSRHMPLGLAVVAAIVTEVTRSPIDLVLMAYQRWREFVNAMLGRFLEKADVTKLTKLVIVTTGYMRMLVDSCLVPTIERYQLFEHKRLLRVIYRRWCVHKLFNSEIVYLLNTMIRKLRADEAMGELFRFLG